MSISKLANNIQGTGIMITLFDYLPSQNGYKIQLLLSYLNQAYTSKFISLFEAKGHADRFRKISPTGTLASVIS